MRFRVYIEVPNQVIIASRPSGIPAGSPLLPLACQFQQAQDATLVGSNNVVPTI